MFQAERKALPVYESERVGGEDHKPEWGSTVTLHDGRVFKTVETYGSRKEAEKHAVKLALESLESTQTVEYEWVNNDSSQTIVYIDVENMARSTLDMLKRLSKSSQPSEGIKLIFVMSKGCQIVDRVSSSIDELSSPQVDYMIIDSLSPDAADMLICLTVADETRMADKNCTFYIASNDRFARTFAEVCNVSGTRKCNIQNITHPTELMKLLWVE